MPALLWCCALLLSAAAVRLPGGATFSAGTPLLLWLNQPAPAALGLVLQGLCYWARGARGRQLVLDGLAAGLALAVAAAAQHFHPHSGWVWVSLVLYLGLVVELRWRWRPLAERVAYLRMQRSLRRLHLVTTLAAAAWQGPWALALLPLLYSTHWAAGNERFRVQAQIEEEVQETFARLSSEKEQAARELSASQQQKEWLEELSRNLELAQTPAQWLATLENSLARCVRFELLLLLEADQPHPALAQRAQSTGQPQLGKCELALPLGQGFTVFLSRRESEWNDVETRWVVWTVRRAWPVLANLLQARQTRRELDHLKKLLHSSQQLSGQLSLEGLLGQLPELCGQLASHEWGLLCGGDGQLLSHWGNLPPASRALVEQAMAQGRTRVLPGALAVPLGELGCLALGRTVPFEEVHVQSLELLGQQLRSAWLRAQALEQLRQYQRQLVLSSQMVAVGGLAAGVAHELNSPLGAVTLMVEGAMRQLSQPEAARAKLERAQLAARRARDIVDRLLSQARNPQQQVQFRLDDCLREGLTFIEPQLRQQGVHLSLAWSDNPTFTGQSSTVQQVMINLLHNAAQAYEGLDREKRVELATFPWGFAVTDWGVGLSAETAARIFEPFYTTRSGGHGLGLWICQDLLRQQGAHIQLVASQQGTRFEVRLGPGGGAQPPLDQ